MLVEGGGVGDATGVEVGDASGVVAVVEVVGG
jgi:hypothetical protein